MAREQRLLQEAQKIGAKFQFFSVGGNLAHLLGYVQEVEGVKYQIEFMFDENFPATPPQIIYSRPITSLLGSAIPLNTLANWTESSEVVAIVEELKDLIEAALAEQATRAPAPASGKLIPKPTPVKQPGGKGASKPKVKPVEIPPPSAPPQEEQWVTPDFSAFPDEEVQAFLAQQGPQGETPAPPQASEPDYGAGAPPEMFYQPPAPAEAKKAPAPKTVSPPPPEEVTYDEPESLAAAEQMALITSEYSADPYGPGRAQIYMTITIEQTFLLKVEFNDFPARPRVVLPPSVTSVLGDPYKTLKVLADWQEDNPNDVVEIIREIERRLYSLKDAETQAKEILGEYRAEKIDDSIAHLHVHVMTFGFKEFFLDIDLTPYPQVPEIKYSPELADLIQVEPEDLDAVKSWKPKSSQAVDIIREISWLVDKNSRLKFELELIESGIKNVSYDPATNVLEVKMAGEMKTKDVNFDFKVSIPPAYPTEPPKVELVTELDEDQESVKKGIDKSMKDYFAQWSTFSFLIDLFNAISKTIFNVSVLTCVLCHKIECPACNVKIAAPEGEETCQARCPHCERDYHRHCWEQTIQAFGKCGFCLRVP